MKFEYQKSANIEEGQKLFGIIAPSIYTYDGVYPLMVSTIDYNEEEVIFVVDQPCGNVKCSFHEMAFLVFESEEEAELMLPRLEFGMGLYAC